MLTTLASQPLHLESVPWISLSMLITPWMKGLHLRCLLIDGQHTIVNSEIPLLVLALDFGSDIPKKITLKSSRLGSCSLWLFSLLNGRNTTQATTTIYLTMATTMMTMMMTMKRAFTLTTRTALTALTDNH